MTVSAIGYPLGNIGLGSTGQYTSYDNYMPSMLGMNYGMGGYGMGMGMNSSIFPGMYGMYNPTFMAQMQQAIESSQIAHAGRMHSNVLTNEINAHRFSDSALIQKILTNSDVQQGVQNLYDKVCKGDQQGICNQFDKLKNYIFTTYKNELAARGDKINPAVAATQIIEAVYANIITTQNGGVPRDLRSDIEKYGESAATNGFMQGFRRGHQNKYVDETMMHCFGLDINQKGHKDDVQTLSSFAGRTASCFEKAFYGGALGFTGTAAALGVGKLFSPTKVEFWKGMGKYGKWATIGTAIVAGLCDAFWQIKNA